MRSVPSFMTRAFRAFTALITLWCLGCSSFEPLLAGLFSAGPGMVCASEGGTERTMSPETDVTGDRGPAASIGTSEEDASLRGFACDCQGCHAPSPVLPTVALDPLPGPSQPLTEPATPSSIEREPLVPPPQLAPSGA